MNDRGQRPWLAAYPETVAWDLAPDTTPLTQAFDETAARFGSRPCLRFLGKSYSYAEVDRLVRRAAKGLQALDVGRGVKVGCCFCRTRPIS